MINASARLFFCNGDCQNIGNGVATWKHRQIGYGVAIGNVTNWVWDAKGEMP